MIPRHQVSEQPGHRQEGKGGIQRLPSMREAIMSKNKKGGKKNQPAPKTLNTEVYDRELAKLQIELVKLQEWIKHRGFKVVVIFEGRDAAGKGGVIKRITQSLNPRICRVVALATPTE